MGKKARSSQLGRFMLPGDIERLGELRLDGPRTLLTFQDSTFIPHLGGSRRCMAS